MSEIAADDTAAPKSKRRYNAVARWTAIAVAGIAVLAISYAPDAKLLMPGPISTVHGSLAKCSSCHTNIADGRFGWLHGLVKYADPEKDSATCLTCHSMGNHAYTPHNVGAGELKAITARLQAAASKTGPAAKTHTHSTVFSMKGLSQGPVFCATCHKEHRGTSADLSLMSDGRCTSCHAVQFESFEAGHPQFEKYPFKRRVRLIFDHSKHFAEYFDETRERQPKLKDIPAACSDCHTSAADKRHMGVKPFAQICSACHLQQIVGTERATGPKGIALLALPGLDLETLREKKIPIGDWPEQSEARITPFMKLLLSGDKERRDLLSAVGKLDLLDLTEASKDQLSAVGQLAWEIKNLIYALTTSSSGDMIKRIRLATGAKHDDQVLARLIASMPRDVLNGAQLEWLPNLPAEIRNRGPIDPKATAAKAAAKKAAKEPPRDRLVTDPKAGRWKVSILGELVQQGSKADRRKITDEPDNKSDSEPPAEPEPEADATPVDSEGWAELGGWYRKDFAILYKPTGHKDPFMRAWLDLSGRVSELASAKLATPIFELLTADDAQGQCTKCHSVDGGHGGGRIVQWSPSSLADKKARFTFFVHEPHFGLLDNRGCLTCHQMDSPKDFAKSYKSLDPAKASLNFKQVRIEQCVACHKQDTARQDCLLCHKYHVAPVTTPITTTKLPDK